MRIAVRHGRDALAGLSAAALELGGSPLGQRWAHRRGGRPRSAALLLGTLRGAVYPFPMRGWVLAGGFLLGCGARTPLSDRDAPAAPRDEGRGATGSGQGAGASGADDGPVVGGLKPDAQWAKEGRNAGNTALAGSKSVAQGKLRWSALLGHDVSPTTPVIDADGTVYVGCSQGLCAYGPDGKKRWASGQEPCAYGSPAIAASGKIFANCGAVDPDTHTLLWSVRSKGLGWVRGPVTIGARGTVYLHTELPDLAQGVKVGGKLTAFSQGGKQLWQVGTAGAMGAMAVGADDTLYHTSFSWGVTDGLRALTPDGATKWEFDAGERLGTPIVMPDGSLVVPGEARLFALSADGEEKWSVAAPTTQSWQMPCGALGPDGTIYVGGHGVLHAVTPGGELLWSKVVSFPDDFSCPLVDGNGNIHVAPDAAELSVFSPTGELLWWLPFGDTSIPHYTASPALAADGTLYVTSMAAPGQDLTTMLYAIGP